MIHNSKAGAMESGLMLSWRPWCRWSVPGKTQESNVKGTTDFPLPYNTHKRRVSSYCPAIFLKYYSLSPTLCHSWPNALSLIHQWHSPPPESTQQTRQPQSFPFSVMQTASHSILHFLLSTLFSIFVSRFYDSASQVPKNQEHKGRSASKARQ